MKTACLIFLLASPVLAADGSWDALEKSCTAEMQPEWLAEVKNGKAWDARSAENLRGLRKMSHKDCPAYLARRNDAGAVRAFVARKESTMDSSPLVDKEGKRLATFLQARFDEHERSFNEAGLDFSRGGCGRRLLATRDLVSARRKEIQSELKTLAKRCIALGDSETVKPVKVVPAKARPASVSGRGAAPVGSDITGLDEQEGP
jgi:hypothetical protein